LPSASSSRRRARSPAQGPGSWFDFSNWSSLIIPPNAGGTIVGNGGTANIPGAALADPTLEINGGSTVNLNASGGSLQATGSITLGPNGTLLLSGSTDVISPSMDFVGGTLRATFTGPALNNINTITFVDGTTSTIAAGAGTTLTLEPTVFVLGQVTGATVKFGSATDTGTIVLTPGAPVVAPNSTIEVAGGTLGFGSLLGSDALALAQSVTVDAGATLTYSTGPSSFSGRIRSLLGAGTVVIPLNLILQGGNSNFAGTISGAGELHLIAAATATLTGTNTYTGGTTIDAGSTLTLANGGSIVGSVDNSGQLVIGSGGTLNLSGSLASGSPGSSLTTVSGGTLRAATTSTVTDNVTFAAATTSAIAAAAGQTLTFTPSELSVGANTSLRIGSATDTGTVVFAPGLGSIGSPGTQTYEVAGGTWRAGNSNPGFGFFTLNGLSTTVDAGATLDLNDLNSGVNTLLGAGQVTTGVNAATVLILTGNGNFSGTISGAGQVNVTSGTTILSGTNTYTGGTTIAAGATLQLGNGGAGGSIAGSVLNNGTFAVNRSDTFTLGNVISGTGAFQQNGTGTTILTATNTYTGPTTVNAGTLVVNGSIANSAVTVNAGATLAGIGTVGATKINSGGTFAPGNSPGTITVQGNLAFQSGALYLVQVNPSTASSTDVTAGGSATLAGTVQAAFASGSYVARTYTILSAAGGLNGTTFNTLTTSNLPAGFTASLSYTATDAILNLTAILGGPSAVGTGGLSGNQLNVANSLNAFFNNGGTLPPSFVGIFGLTGGNLANALSQLSGEAATGAQKVGFQLTDTQGATQAGTDL